MSFFCPFLCIYIYFSFLEEYFFDGQKCLFFCKCQLLLSNFTRKHVINCAFLDICLKDFVVCTIAIIMYVFN